MDKTKSVQKPVGLVKALTHGWPWYKSLLTHKVVKNYICWKTASPPSLSLIEFSLYSCQTSYKISWFFLTLQFKWFPKHSSEEPNLWHARTWWQVGITALFVIALNWKLPKHPSMSQCLNTVVHPQHQPLLSSKTQALICTTIWMNLEEIMLSEERINPQRLHIIWLHLSNIYKITVW